MPIYVNIKHRLFTNYLTDKQKVSPVRIVLMSKSNLQFLGKTIDTFKSRLNNSKNNNTDNIK